VIPVSGTLDEAGVELEVFVDQQPDNSPPNAYPNPSFEGVYIGFDLMDGPADVRLSVFDLTGQLIHSSIRNDLESGAYRAPLPGEAFYWDGYCDDGSQAASGVYIISLGIGDEVQLIKCTIVR
jgi:hypothetical protein